MSSRASRPRSKRHVVGVSAVAMGALLTTYAGAIRTFSYARAVTPAAASCSAGATLVSDDTQLQAAITSSVDGAVICITADITVSATLLIDDTTITLEGREFPEGGQLRDPVLSGDNARRILDGDFTDNSSDDTLTIRDLVLVYGRATGQGGAVLLAGGNRSDALVMTGTEVAANYSTQDGGGVSASNLSSVYIEGSNFHDDTVGDPSAGDIAGGALKVANTAQTTIKDSVFRTNSSVEWGGAVFLNDSGVTRITGSTFEGNSSGTEAGGAIEIDIDDSTLPGAIYITDTVFRSNSTSEGNGGAIRITDSDDTVTFTRVGFYSNAAGTSINSASGGALSISSQTGPIYLTDITAHDNYASDPGGFLRLFDSTAVFSINGLDSQRNESRLNGGSLHLTGAYQRVSGATFVDDSSGVNGGAIRSRNSLELTISNSSFTGTYARADGGALNTTDDSDITLTNVTFISNTAGDDGGAVEINDVRNLYVSGGLFRLNDAGGDDGGGILVNTADDTVSLIDVTFDRNSAVGEGGGVKILSHGGLLIADDLLVTGNSSGSEGGGIYAAPDEAVISNSTFTGNSALGASSDGGALYLRNAFNHDISDVVFDGNFAGRSGGALHISSNNGSDDTTSLSNLTFTDDSAVEDGGSIFARIEGPLSLTSITATGTRSGDDGGFAYLRSDDTALASADFRLYNVAVTNARATDPSGADGGGLSIGYMNGLLLRDVSVTNSSAADDGGGMLVRRAAAVYIYDSSFAGNSAGDVSGGVDLTNIYSQLLVYGTTISGNSSTNYAGGFYTRFAADTQARITNSTFSGNTVSPSGSLGGGGLYLIGASATAPVVDVNFVTVAGNSAKEGGGVQLAGTVSAVIRNSIIAGNSATGNGDDVIVGGSATIDDSYSLFTSAAAVSGATIDGPGSVFGAPKVNGLADNGGPTLTMLPQWDSPAFQAGDPNWSAPPVNDQRGAGFPRDAGGRVSMGAIQGRSAKPIDPVFPPSAPREVAAVAGDGQAVVSWKAPASNGSFPVTDYQIDDSTGEFSVLVQVAPGEPLSALIEDLVNGQEYSFRVRALNGAGWGSWSDYSDPVVPQPGPSILITGTRDGRFARVAGETTGLVGATMVPRIRFPGPDTYKDGVSRPVVDAEGAFAWQRQGGKKTYVYFFTEDRQLRSNRVIIRAKN